MKVIIAGSRHMPSSQTHLIQRAVKASKFKVTEVVCGMAKGADTLGKEWAEKKNIPVKEFPAKWGIYGRGAGPVRNREMSHYADALIVFIWGNSRGSLNMLTQMQAEDKPCFVINEGVVVK